MASAGTVGPLHQAGPCSGVHHAAHAGHGTLQVSAGPPRCAGLPARDLLCGAGMPAQVSGGCTTGRLGGQACGMPLLLLLLLKCVYCTYLCDKPTLLKCVYCTYLCDKQNQCRAADNGKKLSDGIWQDLVSRYGV